MPSTINITTNTKKEGQLRVGFATNDQENIDAHFGSAKQFCVYDVDTQGSTISSIITIDTKDTDATVALLDGVDIVYFVNIGPTAAAKIINSGIFPIKYKEVVSIANELEKLSSMLGTNPPPFIKKIVQKKAA